MEKPGPAEVAGSSQSEGFKGGSKMRGLEVLHQLNPETKEETGLTDEQLAEVVGEFSKIAKKLESDEDRQEALANLMIHRYGIHSPAQVHQITEAFIERHGLTAQTLVDHDNAATMLTFASPEDGPFNRERAVLGNMYVGLERLEEKTPQEQVPDQPKPENQPPAAPAEVAPPVAKAADALSPVPATETPPPSEPQPQAELKSTQEVQIARLKNGSLREWVLETLKEASLKPDIHDAGKLMIELKEEFIKQTSEIKPEDDSVNELDSLRQILGVEKPVDKKPAVTGEALRDFTEEAQKDRPPTVKKAMELWHKYTHKTGRDIGGAEKVFDNEHNKDGSDTLRQARAQLAALRAFERRTAIRKLEPGELESAEKEYNEAFREHLIDELVRLKKVVKAEGGEITQDALRAIVSQHLTDEMTRRSELEAAVIEARGGRGAKGTNWLRKHPKLRIAAGLVLAGGGIGLAFAGAGLPAAAFGAARVGMRAFGGYDTALNVQERWGAKRDHAENKKHDEARDLSGAKLDNLNDQQRVQKSANLLAVNAQLIGSEKYAAADQKLIDKLMAENKESYIKMFKNAEARYTGVNFIVGVDGVTSVLIAEQLKAENNRLNSDKKVGSRRFKRAAVIGAVIAVLPLGSLVDHTLGGDGGKNGISAEKSNKESSDSVFNQPSDSQSSRDNYRSGGDSVERPRLRFADREWKIQAGESQWRIAYEIMNYHPSSFGDLDPQQKMVAVDRLKDLMGGKDLIHPGDIQEVKGGWVKDALETGRNYK